MVPARGRWPTRLCIWLHLTDMESTSFYHALSVQPSSSSSQLGDSVVITVRGMCPFALFAGMILTDIIVCGLLCSLYWLGYCCHAAPTPVREQHLGGSPSLDDAPRVTGSAATGIIGAQLRKRADTGWIIKARLTQACQCCGQKICIGDTIVKADIGWCHLRCDLALDID